MRFLLVDGILEWEPGKRARGIKNVSLSEDFFDDHFPLKPIMPGVLIIEGMAQLSGILLEESVKTDQPAAGPGGAKVKALMSMVEKAKFRRPVYPGSRLIYECDILQLNDLGGKVAASAFADDAVVAECSLLFSFHNFGNPVQDGIRARILNTWLSNVPNAAL